jgi:REP element-mobilizing transposase RayT
MASYTRLLYHLVWSTYKRQPAFFGPERRAMHAYIHGILTAKECLVLRIGGVEEHVHVLMVMHQSLRPQDLVRDLKASSSKWLRSCGRFPQFHRWQKGGGVFTVGWREKDELIEYIKNQEEHHKTETFMEEYIRLIRENGMTYREEDD